MASYRETPSAVRLAVTLFWVSFWIGAAGGLWNYQRQSVAGWQTQMAVTTLLSILVAGLLCTFLFDKILQGRNWARLLVCVGFGLGLLGTLATAGTLIRNPMQPEILGVLRILLSAFGLKLLFSSPGKEWFAARDVQNTP